MVSGLNNMIDRKALKQMGFALETDWDHEVWAYHGGFRVHYKGALSGVCGNEISGDASMEDFFKMFISNREEEAISWWE